MKTTATLDAGFYFLTASLGNFVFEDVNANGQQETGEPGIQGVAVTLISNGTVVATTATDADGLYSFTGLNPGQPYSVSFGTPANYSATVADTGNDVTDSDAISGLTDVYSLTANETNLTVDAGFYRAAILGDRVFADNNRNGIDDSEPGIEGVTVTLISNGLALATTSTDANGFYQFQGLIPGIPYSVSFSTPANYSASTADVGGNDTVDSDAIGGITAPVQLTSGENNTTLDAGFILLRFNLSLSKALFSAPEPTFTGQPDYVPDCCDQRGRDYRHQHAGDRYPTSGIEFRCSQQPSVHQQRNGGHGYYCDAGPRTECHTEHRLYFVDQHECDSDQSG